MFREYTPWNMPSRPPGAYTLRRVDPFGHPVPRATAESYARLSREGHDAASLYHLTDLLTYHRSDDSQRTRILVKPKINIRLKNSAVTVIQNSTVGSLTHGGRHRTKKLTRVRNAPLFSIFSRRG